jgi:two-component system, LytTR family, response regulator
MRVLLIDDEPLALSLMQEYLQAHPDVEVLRTCKDGFEGLKAVQELKPELIFLDIQMPKITGLEMLELIEEPPAVIFTTAFDQYAIKAFELSAVDYLLKPFSPERLAVALAKVRERLVSKRQGREVENLLQNQVTETIRRVVVKTGNNVKVIPLQDIHYFEASDDYVCIHTSDNKFVKTQTLKSLENRLEEGLFVRVHRSFLVQLQQVTRIEPYEKDGHLVVLRSGKKIPVSKSGYPRLKAALGV